MTLPETTAADLPAPSRWERLRDRLAKGIAQGRLQPGMQLPTEAGLCRCFDAGRHSVRRGS